MTRPRHKPAIPPSEESIPAILKQYGWAKGRSISTATLYAALDWLWEEFNARQLAGGEKGKWTQNEERRARK